MYKKAKWTILSQQCFHMFHRLIFNVQKGKMCYTTPSVFSYVPQAHIQCTKKQNGLYYAISVFICSIGSYSMYKKAKWTILSHQCFHMFHRLIFNVQKGKMYYTTPSVFSYVPQAHIQCTKKAKWTILRHQCFHMFHRLIFSVQKKAKWTILRHQCFHMFHRFIFSVQKKAKWTILRHQCFHMFHRLIFSVQKKAKWTILRHQCFHMCHRFIFSVQKKAKWTILCHQCFHMFHRLIFSVQKGKMDCTTPSLFSYVP